MCCVSIITEMDSNTLGTCIKSYFLGLSLTVMLVHPDYCAEVDRVGNILLGPVVEKATSSTTEWTAEDENLDPVTVDIIESALASAREEMDGESINLFCVSLELILVVVTTALMTKCAMSPGCVNVVKRFLGKI
jgi:hypothetical protein